MPVHRAWGSRLVAAAALFAALCLAGCDGSSHSLEAEKRCARLSLEQKAAQVLLIGVGGKTEPTPSSRELLASMPLGGLILFSFNIDDDPLNIGRFTAALQDAQAGKSLGLPLFIALDHEGGSVLRLRRGVTPLPAPAEAALRGPSYAKLLGEASGRELRALGITMALAPVVEVLDDYNRDFLGSRSYGQDPALVDRTAGAFIQGLQAAGLVSVAKHFPGNAALDPHRGLPLLELDRQGYERDIAARFASAGKRGVAGVMISHISVPMLDAENPATISRAVIGGELRGRLRFRGLVLTDDLYMKALAEDFPPTVSAVRALAAGADLLMLSSPASALQVRDAIVLSVRSGGLGESRLDEAVRRIIETKLRFGLEDYLDPEKRGRLFDAFPSILAENTRRLAAFDRASP